MHLGVLAVDILPDEGIIGESRELVASIMKVTSVMVGLWLWGLSMWFFFVSVGSLFKYLRPDHRLPFVMTWWSFVFPNTALVSICWDAAVQVVLFLTAEQVTATEQLGKAFGNEPLKIIGCVMAALLVCVWFLVFGTMIRAVVRKQLLWPKDVLP